MLSAKARRRKASSAPRDTHHRFHALPFQIFFSPLASVRNPQNEQKDTCSIPPIEIDAGDEKVYIEGIIDRIDILPDGSVKVIDYKSGSEKFSVKEAKAGWKLQLMLYLKAGLEYGRRRRSYLCPSA